jgi:SAM-dependent methyltransferase
MRFYVLDDLVSPLNGTPLRVENPVVSERAGPDERCRNWCGLLGTTPDKARDADCTRCASAWIDTGVLTDGIQRFPIIAGIPRFVRDDDRVDADTQESFGYEWQHFNKVLDDYDAEIDSYFHIVPQSMLRDAVVLDAGCGMGRWSRHVAARGAKRVYTVDFSRAIDAAAQNLRDRPNAHCIQADLTRLPFRDGAMDFTYCLGVLHHLEDPDKGMKSVARVTRGGLLVYLYYKLDNRPSPYRALLALATAARVITSRLPKRVMHWLSWPIALVVYWPLARLARVLERLGLPRAAHHLPFSHYRGYSLSFMVGDAFDRFATPIENRYSRAEIAQWLARYGLDATFSERTPFWTALGRPKQ